MNTHWYRTHIRGFWSRGELKGYRKRRSGGGRVRHGKAPATVRARRLGRLLADEGRWG